MRTPKRTSYSQKEKKKNAKKKHFTNTKNNALNSQKHTVNCFKIKQSSEICQNEKAKRKKLIAQVKGAQQGKREQIHFEKLKVHGKQ